MGRCDRNVRSGGASSVYPPPERVHSAVSKDLIDLFFCRSGIALRILLAGLIAACSGVISRSEPLPRSVLIFDKSGLGAFNPGYSDISRAFRKTLVANSPARVHGVNLDLQEFPGPAHDAALRNYVKDKYRDEPIGVLFAVGSSALQIRGADAL